MFLHDNFLIIIYNIHLYIINFYIAKWSITFNKLKKLDSFHVDPWWAPKMGNLLCSFCLLLSINPPFFIVLCILLNIFMLIEWMRIVTWPQSLICVYCRFMDIFWTKVKHLWVIWQPNTKEQGWGFVGRVPPALNDPFLEFSIINLEFNNPPKMISRGSQQV